MTKTDSRRGFAIALVIAVLAAAVATNQEAREEAINQARLTRGRTTASYYAQLEGRCADSCCRSSVAEMRLVRGTIQPQNGCAGGQSADMLPCASSYRWCHE